MWDIIIFLLVAFGGLGVVVTTINGLAHHQTHQLITRDMESIDTTHVEWQSRVNHFYALGAEAERTGDWLAAQRVAMNLDFLLETEPLKSATKVKIVAPVKRVPQLDRSTDGARPDVQVNQPQKVPSTEELLGRVEHRSETWRPDETRLGFCNVCAHQFEHDHFQRHQVAGICDLCYDETHEGTT